MSVARQANLLGQQRLDIPHVRGIESSIANDFDILAGQIMAGRAPLIVSGFNIVPVAAGTAATSIQIAVAGSVIMHPLASESGTIFQVPSTRTPETLNAANTRLSGTFTAGAVNYIGIDLRRTADATTADLVQFLNADTITENPKSVPLARTLDYVIVISTQDFTTSPGIAPLAKVTTDAFNNVATTTYNAVTYAAIEDARNFMFRLGSGGSVTNPLNAYNWPFGRTEVGNNTDFSAGDKGITSFKAWFDAVMTRLWEQGGGEHWFSPTADRNVQLMRVGGTLFSSTGDYFEWTGTNLHWQGLRVTFDNSTGYYNDIKDQLVDSAGLTDLADGWCVYVDLDRTANRTGGTALQPVKQSVLLLGTPTVPGSRLILAWRSGTKIFTRGTSYPIGQAFQVATVGALGVVKLHQAATTPLSPIVLSDGDLNTTNGVVALDASRAASWTALAGSNAAAITATGDGTGSGGNFIGGSNGAGLFAQGNSGREGVNATGGSGGGAGVVALGVGAGAGVSATGGASGIGGKFTGGGSGAGVDATGGSSGPGVVLHGVLNNQAAQERAQRSDGLPAATYDYLGYRSGWVIEERIFGQCPILSGAGTARLGAWRVDGTTNSNGGYQVGLAGGGAWAGGSLHANCNSSRTASDWSVIGSPQFYNATHDPVTFDPKGIFDTQVWVVELQFAISGGTIGSAPAASADFFIGWSQQIAGTTPWSAASNVVAGIRFKQSSGDAAWLAYSGDGTTQTTLPLTSTPVMTSDTRHRLRIELHRANSPYGNCIRIFMDGVLTTKTTNLPIIASLGADCAFLVGVWSTGTVASVAEITCGQIRINGNYGDTGVLTAGPTSSDV